MTFTPADDLAPPGTVLGADAPAVEKRAQRKPLDPAHQAIVDERKAKAGPGRPHRPTRDALIELQYRNMGRLSERVMKRLERALDNEADPLHEMVVEKLMQRVVPMAFWESLGKQEFKEEEGGDKRPIFQINIGAAAPPVEKIEHQPVTVDVKALPK